MSLFEGPSLLCLEETKLQDDDEATRLKQHTTTVSNRSHKQLRHRPTVRRGSGSGGSGGRYLQLLHVTEAQLITEYQQTLKFNRHRWSLRKPYCQMLDSKTSLVFAVKCIEVLYIFKCFKGLTYYVQLVQFTSKHIEIFEVQLN